MYARHYGAGGVSEAERAIRNWECLLQQSASEVRFIAYFTSSFCLLGLDLNWNVFSIAVHALCNFRNWKSSLLNGSFVRSLLRCRRTFWGGASDLELSLRAAEIRFWSRNFCLFLSSRLECVVYGCLKIFLWCSYHALFKELANAGIVRARCWMEALCGHHQI